MECGVNWSGRGFRWERGLLELARMRERPKRGISEREELGRRSACGVRVKEKPQGEGHGALAGVAVSQSQELLKAAAA